MLNHLWLGMLVVAVLVGGFTGHLKETGEGAIEAAKTAVTITLGLVGVMALWLGIMRLAERSGLVSALARLLRPLLVWLFPDVPANHPAMGSMVMNIAANMLGLNNAATPLGLRAMRDLETLNPQPGTATNAMCTFLAINTGSVQLISVNAIAVLAAAGSKNPTAIVGTTLLATTFSSLAALIVVKVLERFSPAPKGPPAQLAQAGAVAASPSEGFNEATLPPLRGAHWLALAAFVAAFGWFLFALVFPESVGRTLPADQVGQAMGVRLLNAISLLAIPFMVAFFPFYAWLRKLPVFEEFVEGAKDGFQVAVGIIPFFVAMWVAIGSLRGAGVIELLTTATGPLLAKVGFPAELLPMSLIRPLSGSGSLAALSDLVKTLGPDHLVTRMAATIYGSTETTFYVVAVYFGAVAIKRTRHAIWAGLAADLAGVIAAVVVCRMVLQ